MRITLDIDDDVLAIAEAENRPLGSVISELARHGLVPRQRDRRRGFPTFDVPLDAAPITSELVDRALDE